MKKPVIGLNLKYLKVAFGASAVGAAAAFLPYVSAQGEKMNSFGVLKNIIGAQQMSLISWILGAAVIASLFTLALGILNLVKPSVAGVRMWIVLGIVQAFAYTVLLMGSKSMLDGADILTESFLVKDFGVGFWLSLICSYAGLYAAMKVAKINPGYIVLTLLSVVWLFPILWILLTSFRAEQGYYVGYFIPRGFTLDNYLNLFAADSAISFGKWWTNTLIVAICTCVLSTLIILATAYTLSRTRFAGRKTLMQAMLIIGMFPGFMSMIAVYNILKGLGLAQTLTALVVVAAAGAAMGYYVCKGFFDTIPKSLDEAAIIDGATRWQIFTRITVPLSKPIIIYTILTSFLGAWSDYIFPSMVMGDKQDSYTVALGLYWMTDFRRIDHYYTQFAAGAVLVAIPIVILFIWLQKYYVEGLSGAVKG